MRRGVLPVVGSRIKSVQRPPCKLQPILLQPRIDAFDRRVRGKQIIEVGRRGKRVMIGLEDDQTIVIEPRMTGLVLLADPPNQEHLRLRMNLSDGRNQQLLFWDRRGLGTVRLLRPKEVAELIDARLGSDALVIGTDELRQRLGRSRRAIKVALLDQAAVAGIGNLYAAEILFQAGVDPRTRCDQLSRAQWERIQQAIVLVLEEAIKFEGSTLSDGTYRNALNNAGSYQSHHRVYDRADMSCRRCPSGVVRRIVQAQRSTFFCPVCQRKRGLHATLAAN